MNMKKWISKEIYKELSYTNGWQIDDDSYKSICDKLAIKILNNVGTLEEIKIKLHNRIDDLKEYGASPEGYTLVRYPDVAVMIDKVFDKLVQ